MSTPTRVSTRSRQVDLSPVREAIIDQEQDMARDDFEILPRVANVPPWMRKPKDTLWKVKKICNRKYVDDGINAEKINMRSERLLMRGQHMFKESNAPQTASLLNHIKTC